jgi:hypothetical protein
LFLRWSRAEAFFIRVLGVPGRGEILRGCRSRLGARAESRGLRAVICHRGLQSGGDIARAKIFGRSPRVDAAAQASERHRERERAYDASGVVRRQADRLGNRDNGTGFYCFLRFAIKRARAQGVGRACGAINLSFRLGGRPSPVGLRIIDPTPQFDRPREATGEIDSMF